jgi:hypothetical protein
VQRPDPSLHEEYFLLAHDDYTGRAHIDEDVVGAGLAGALLADLVIVGCLDAAWLDAGGEQVRVLDESLALDGLARDAVAALATRTRPVSWWVECLAVSMYQRTGEHLVHQGVVTRAPAGLFRAGVRYPAVDALVAAGPRVRLRHEAEAAQPVPPDPGVATLAALALRTGLGGVVADAANRSVREGLAALARAVPVGVRAVVAGVDAALIQMALTTPRGR